ncbi:hypothetical protein Ahy_A01g002580 isoform B [Arachis hypogaea]|uniref:Uncharacterized protein n=1 Tax=Arachis hypogaea TaxID=3818 RepID=A0A445ERA4_ARAHY|nr:hypothetical protein Ahy_A01g002580 isoform B [Arachis hypogaea]
MGGASEDESVSETERDVECERDEKPKNPSTVSLHHRRRKEWHTAVLPSCSKSSTPIRFHRSHLLPRVRRPSSLSAQPRFRRRWLPLTFASSFSRRLRSRSSPFKFGRRSPFAFVWKPRCPASNSATNPRAPPSLTTHHPTSKLKPITGPFSPFSLCRPPCPSSLCRRGSSPLRCSHRGSSPLLCSLPWVVAASPLLVVSASPLLAGVVSASMLQTISHRRCFSVVASLLRVESCSQSDYLSSCLKSLVSASTLSGLKSLLLCFKPSTLSGLKSQSLTLPDQMVFPIKTEPIRITNTPGSCHLLQSAISAVSLSCFLLVFYISTLQFQIPNNRRKMTRQGAYKESDDMLIDEPKLPQQGQSQPFLMNKLFPHADLYRWMSYGNDGKHPACDSSYLGRRKFSYTLDNDIFVRYNTFNSAAELENSIKDKCPLKIDIGPIYNLNIRYESLFLLILS